jgi:RNA polymerase sigma-70 factor, ECF subfamily
LFSALNGAVGGEILNPFRLFWVRIFITTQIFQRNVVLGASYVLKARMVAPSKDIETQELVSLAQGGDPAAFDELFDRFYPMIYAFSYRASLNVAQAQDLAQETLIKVARCLGTYRGDSSFKSWIYQIATNTTRDWLRKQAREERLAEAAVDQWAAGGEGTEPEHTRLTEALGALPDDLRLAIVLTFYEGMSHAEAARTLGCAETTVSWRIFRAKQKLKQLLSKEERP